MNSTKKLFGGKTGSVIEIRVWRASKIRDPRERLLVGIIILLKYFIMKFSRNAQPCKVWNETNQKYRIQYEIVFIIMIVLGKKMMQQKLFLNSNFSIRNVYSNWTRGFRAYQRGH